MILAYGGIIHDAGKVIIPKEVLNKPGKPNPEEWRILQGHVTATLDLLKDVRVPEGALLIAAQHHEKLNGKGYPVGLKGDQINELARLAVIVDIFSALTDDRPYKKAMPADKALELMRTQMSEELDMRYLAVFHKALLSSNMKGMI